MLFLAISAGFLPENIRENRSDTHKEKDYMNSFYNDLKSDICPRWGPTLVSTDITPWMGQTVISTDITTRIEVMDLLWIKMIFIFS
jgi:hypothetical protein